LNVDRTVQDSLSNIPADKSSQRKAVIVPEIARDAAVPEPGF
jgi:hypothetical protein